jgi:hypothetical protein
VATSAEAQLKHVVGLAIGRPICRLRFLRPYKNRLLATWHVQGKRDGLGRVLFAPVVYSWFHDEYLREPDPNKREEMKALLMGGESGRNWADTYNARPIDFRERVGALSYPDAYPVLGEVDRKLKEETDAVVVVQLGSSSGREPAWLAERWPQHQFIGTDIYPEVISYSAEKHPLSNLRFELYSAQTAPSLLSGFPAARKKLVLSSGTLQYIQPEHLKTCFASLAQVPNLQVLLQEPGSEAAGSPDGLRGTRWRGNFSYTHDYRFYAEQAGFRTSRCNIIRPYQPKAAFPKHAETIHYYYAGVSAKADGVRA